MTASERESLIRLNVAFEILTTEGEQLRKRFTGVKYGLRDLGMLKAVIHRLMEQVIDTIPEEQMMTYVRSLQMASYTVGVKRPGTNGSRNEKDYGMWLPYEVINGLLQGCHDHCMMCPGDRAERRACRLRKALETIPNDAQEREDGDCPFYTLM